MNNIIFFLGVIITLATGIPVLLQILRNHPKGLIILFFAEMWERFSYYGMRGILIFYLTQHFLFDDSVASGHYGSYTSLVYLLPLLGGFLADRFIGTRKAVAFGALLLVAGHGLMAFEGNPATQTLNYGGEKYEVRLTGRADTRETKLMIGGQAYDFKPADGGGLEIVGLPAGGPVPQVLPANSFELEASRDPNGTNVFFLAISLIIMGVGYLKPNISTIVGQLYPANDPRRDSGFTLYYYGINLGAFWASFWCAYLGQTYGWGYGFGLAGIGMLLGLIVFILGKPLLQGKGEPPNPERLKEPFLGPINREMGCYLLGLALVPVIWWLVQRNDIVGMALGVLGLASLAVVAYIIFFVCKTWVQRQRMMLAMVLIFGAVVFFTLFEQAGTSLNLFADRNVDLTVFAEPIRMAFMGQDWVFASAAQLESAGIDRNAVTWIDTGITAGQTQSFNAAFILILAPVFAALWASLARKGKDPNPTMKFGLGLIQVGLGFLVVVWAALSPDMVDSAFRMPLFMLGLLYLLHTTGELFLSPVGLSEITKLALPQVVSFMMAVWFLSSSFAQYIGGTIAGLMGTETVGGQVLDPQAALAASLDGFTKLGYAGVAAGVLFVLISFLIKNWSHEGVEDNSPGPDLTDRGQEDRNASDPAPTQPH